jgi:hypothetical protein
MDGRRELKRKFILPMPISVYLWQINHFSLSQIISKSDDSILFVLSHSCHCPLREK